MAVGVGLAMTLASGGLSAYSSYQQGKAQQANAEYNAELSKNQAKQGEMEAQENANRGWKNEEEQLASIRARMANEGSIADQGAPLAMMGDIAGELELGVQDSYRQASIQRNNLYNQAAITRQQGKQARKAGTLMALTQIGTTAMNFDTKYNTGVRSGVIKKTTTRGQALMGAFGYKRKQYFNTKIS